MLILCWQKHVLWAGTHPLHFLFKLVGVFSPSLGAHVNKSLNKVKSFMWFEENHTRLFFWFRSSELPCHPEKRIHAQRHLYVCVYLLIHGYMEVFSCSSQKNLKRSFITNYSQMLKVLNVRRRSQYIPTMFIMYECSDGLFGVQGLGSCNSEKN